MGSKRVMAGAMAVCLWTLAAVGAEEAAAKGPHKGDQGTIVGAITQMDHGKITVKGEEGEMVLMPFWRGGMPAKGGGFDKEMMKRLEHFKVGDQVKVEWVFEEHARIKQIEKAGAAAKTETTEKPK